MKLTEVIFSTALLILSGTATAQAEAKIQNSFQTGFEYDSNVFKTFGEGAGDQLFRLLFQSQASFPFQTDYSVGWRYQGGGKLFLHNTEQDILIQYLQVPLSWRVTPSLWIGLFPDLKYQNESNALDDTQPAPQDVNEDYLSTTTQMLMRWSLGEGFSLEPTGEFTYYDFQPLAAYSYNFERGGLTVRKMFGELFALGADYGYSAQQFEAGGRDDVENAFSGFAQFLGIPYVSARYTYENSDSSDPSYSFTNHRVTFLFSLPIGSLEENPSVADVEEPLARVVLHLYVIYQKKAYASVFAVDQEGTRYLLTGAEDDNFNSILAKVTYHLFPWVALEGKYTLHFNAVSSQPDSFNRSLLYGGVRLSF